VKTEIKSANYDFSFVQTDDATGRTQEIELFADSVGGYIALGVKDFQRNFAYLDLSIAEAEAIANEILRVVHNYHGWENSLFGFGGDPHDGPHIIWTF
jgi:hypothetical protein